MAKQKEGEKALFCRGKAALCLIFYCKTAA